MPVMLPLISALAPALVLSPESELIRVIQVEELKTQAGFQIYIPDSAHIGYTLREATITSVQADGQLPGIGARKAVRLNYRNDRTSHEFDLLQSKTTSQINALKHGRRLIQMAKFPIHVDEHTTTFGVKKGSTDVAFFASLISEPSAKTLLGDLRPLK
jgi:hypothetical protein